MKKNYSFSEFLREGIVLLFLIMYSLYKVDIVKEVGRMETKVIEEVCYKVLKYMVNYYVVFK